MRFPLGRQGTITSQHQAQHHHYDVVIVGGGVIGSATAWHLLEAAPGVSVAVVEPDQTYQAAASSTASGGVRQLFTRPENVLMSRYTHEVIRDWTTLSAEESSADDERPDSAPTDDLGWTPNGYLFITEPSLSDQLRKDFEQQQRLGVGNEWLEPDEVAERYPCISTDGLGPAVLSPEDGWLDPHAFLRGLRRRGRVLGATQIQGRVVGFEVAARRIVSARLESGEEIRGDSFVNVAGVRGPHLPAQLGLQLPVEPMRRFDHYAKTTADFAGYPFVKDPAGLAVRPEGDGLTAALVDFSHPGGFDLSIDKTYFERVVWPALIERIPVTDELKLMSTWAGLYDQNRLDGNMILDRWNTEVDNYYFATGFSGHGLMHAPAVGRALTELLLHSSFQTIDLTRMGLERVVDGVPYRELAIR